MCCRLCDNVWTRMNRTETEKSVEMVLMHSRWIMNRSGAGSLRIYWSLARDCLGFCFLKQPCNPLMAASKGVSWGSLTWNSKNGVFVILTPHPECLFCLCNLGEWVPAPGRSVELTVSLHVNHLLTGMRVPAGLIPSSVIVRLSCVVLL